MTSSLVHHVGMAVCDMDESIRFYRDGLGLQIILDEVFERDWMRLVGTPAPRMHCVVLANPNDFTCPIELIAFEDGVERPPATQPFGLFLISLQVDDVDATRARLAELGYGPFEDDFNVIGDVRIDLTFLRDPDGNIIELAPSAAVQKLQL